MVRGMVLFAVVVVLLVGGVMVGGVIGRPARPDEPALTLTGDVHVVTAPDGKTTAVTVDLGDQASLPDGIVDHAFRLQHHEIKALEYDGPATVDYAKGHLTVRPNDREAWVFEVADDAVTTAQGLASKGFGIAVIGLSHHWGKAIHRSPEEATASLLAGSCSMAGGDPTCENCEAGGPGAEGCGVECGGGAGCSVSCVADSIPCCSCNTGCRCCPPREQEPAHVAAK
jgi:hypothetical protein